MTGIEKENVSEKSEKKRSRYRGAITSDFADGGGGDDGGGSGERSPRTPRATAGDGDRVLKKKQIGSWKNK